MGFIATDKSEYQLIPEGTHRAVCSALIDLGPQDVFGSTKRQLLIRFEFPDCRIIRERDGMQVSEPMIKWQFYTNSLNKMSNLRRDLEGWRGRGFTKEELDGFDLRNIVGQACQVLVIHDNSGEQAKAKFQTISKLDGDGQKPEPELEVIQYSEEAGVVKQWDLLPSWIQDKIRQSSKEDLPQQPIQSVDKPPLDDEIPF